MNYSPLSKVRIKDFQAVEDAELELGGLTVLVGPGDAGKSAILRAIRTVFLNDAIDDDIRHGANRCEVELSFEDGMSLAWWKEQGKGGCYQVAKPSKTEPSGFTRTTYTKTGGAVPAPVAEYLGIGRIEVDPTTELTPQLSDQHDQPFILWETGSKRARILGKATRLDVVVTAQMACKKELGDRRREAERAARELEEVTEQLTGFPDIEGLIRRLNEVESTRALVVGAFALADRARELRDQLVEVRSRARAVDVGGLRWALHRSVDFLDRAELLSQVSQARLDVQETYSQGAESQRKVDKAHSDYTAACQDAGVCAVCGGLLDHEECIPQ